MDAKIDRLLKWINNTYDDNFQASTHLYISPKTEVKEVADFGRGIYAKEPVKSKELIIRIPHSFLLNSVAVIRHIGKFNESIKLNDLLYSNIYVPQTIPDDFTEIYGKFTQEELLELSSFQLLSLFICFENQRGEHSFWKPFIDMLPDISDFILCPLIWKVLKVDSYTELLKSLPKSTARHSEKVYERFMGDYNVVKSLVDTKSQKSILPIDLFLWAWMCINSRCLYMDLPLSKNSSDSFTMAPYVDFLNHSCEDQCQLKIDGLGFQVYTSTAYNTNDQLYLSYGPHSNDFLLCEYGFVIPSENKWNDLDISDMIILLLKENQSEFLKANNYYGEYTINIESGVSFRTEVALATLQEPYPETSRKLQALVNGYSDGAVYQKNSNTLLKKILEKVIHECDNKYRLEFSDDMEETTRARKKVIGSLYYNMKQIAEKIMKDM